MALPLFVIDPKSQKDLLSFLDNLGMGKTQKGYAVMRDLLPEAVFRNLEQKISAHPYRYYDTNQWCAWWAQAQRECLTEGSLEVQRIVSTLQSNRRLDNTSGNDEGIQSGSTALQVVLHPWDSPQLNRFKQEKKDIVSTLEEGLWLKVPRVWWSPDIVKHPLSLISVFTQVLEKIEQSALEDPMGGVLTHWFKTTPLLHWSVNTSANSNTKGVLKGLEYLESQGWNALKGRHRLYDVVAKVHEHAFLEVQKNWDLTRVQDKVLCIAVDVLKSSGHYYHKYWIDELGYTEKKSLQGAARTWLQNALTAGAQKKLEPALFKKIKTLLMGNSALYEQIATSEELKRILAPQESVLSLTHESVEYTYKIDVGSLVIRSQQESSNKESALTLGKIASNLSVFKESTPKYLSGYLKERSVWSHSVAKKGLLSINWEYLEESINGTSVRSIACMLKGNCLKNEQLHRWLVECLQKVVSMPVCKEEHVLAWCEQWMIDQKIQQTQNAVLGGGAAKKEPKEQTDAKANGMRRL